MSFTDKVEKIEQARKLYPEFNTAFNEYLGLGHSFNGAYNYFSEADIEKYKPKLEEKINVKVAEKPATAAIAGVKTKVVKAAQTTKV